MNFNCPNPDCGEPFQVSNDDAGQTRTCPACGGEFTVPSSAPDEAAHESVEETEPADAEQPAADSAGPERPGTFLGQVSRLCAPAWSLVCRAAGVCRSLGERLWGRRGKAGPVVKFCTARLEKFGVWLWHWCRLLTRQLREAIHFYRSHRSQLAAYLRDYWGDQDRKREIRIGPETVKDSVTWDDASCFVQLPDSCVVCGKQADEDWQEQTLTAVDLEQSIKVPLAALGVGVVLWLPVFVSSYLYWILILFLLLAVGLVWGHRLRGETEVKLCFRRCEKHADRTNYPAVRWFDEHVIISVGRSSVRQRFVKVTGGFTTPAGNDPLPSATGDAPPEEPGPKWYEKPLTLAGDDDEPTHPGDDPNRAGGSTGPDASDLPPAIEFEEDAGSSVPASDDDPSTSIQSDPSAETYGFKGTRPPARDDDSTTRPK